MRHYRARPTPALATGLAIVLLLFVTDGCTSRGAEPESGIEAVATLDEVMDAIVIPSSQAIFDAVVYEDGKLVAAPKNDEDWHVVRMHALASAEAANLILMAPRAKDGGEWVKRSQEFRRASLAAADAAREKSIDRLLTAGGELYNTCTSCHRQYLMEDGG